MEVEGEEKEKWFHQVSTVEEWCGSSVTKLSQTATITARPSLRIKRFFSLLFLFCCSFCYFLFQSSHILFTMAKSRTPPFVINLFLCVDVTVVSMKFGDEFWGHSYLRQGQLYILFDS